MTHSSSKPIVEQRLSIEVRGVVQGVGFRPFVFRTAMRQELVGWVQNDSDMVRIEVQGTRDRLDAFCRSLRVEHPHQARIDTMDVRRVDCRRDEQASFQIRPSMGQGPPRPTVPPDLATCNACLEEIRTPGERRYGYAFTNCTNCGPRWSIIERLPYDRPRTSMSGFALCAECRREYEDPTDRRFHAQPVACPACGPHLEFLDPMKLDSTKLDPTESATASGNDALADAAEAVRSGCILALKGLGGFQLIVDATDSEAVARLRRKKQRPDKAFAVMFASLDAARRRCWISDEEADRLMSHEAPILLLRHRNDTEAVNDVAAEVAPDNPYLGVMLPYTPLHHLLLELVDRPVVCTSGNLSEEPMAVSIDEALERLGPIADRFLTHDRPIVRPVDDSVGRVGPDGLQLLRRARGFAPIPIDLGCKGPTVLALGGHLKNTVALTLGSQAIMTPHVGDLDNVSSVATHRRVVRDLVGFFDVVPDLVACDLHPDYASTRHAEELAAEWCVPLVRIQHHHAHLAACRAEHRLEGPVLGFSFDGTGYGPDGTVWGGEVLRCDGTNFDRVARLRTFALPGGDRAAQEPRRSALGLLFEILGDRATEYAADWFTRTELDTLTTLLARAIHSPKTSSLGRLFDAIACLCGLASTISFEGQAAMSLEFAADSRETSSYPIAVSDGSPAVIDWEPLVRAVLEDRRAGCPIGVMSARFHNALAEAAVVVAGRHDCHQIVLTGGCFQNALLSDRVRLRLLETGYDINTHQKVPPGDGGLALGQAFLAARQSGGSVIRQLERSIPCV